MQDLADFEKLSDEEKHALKTVISYLNPNELLINKSLAFGIYPYVNAAEAQLYLSKQMWEEANHFMTFEYIIETFPFDREEIYAAGFDTDTYSLNVVNNIPTPFTIDLSQYSGVVKIAFYAESTVSNADNDLYFDNIVLKKIVYDPPTVVTLPADNIGDNTVTLHMTAKEGSHIIDAQGFFYKTDTASATWKRTLDSIVTYSDRKSVV